MLKHGTDWEEGLVPAEKPEDLLAKTLAMNLFGGDDLVAGEARV